MGMHVPFGNLKLRHRGILSLVFLVVLGGLVFGGGGYLGLFASVETFRAEVGPSVFVGVEQVGTYRKIHRVLHSEAEPALERQHIDLAGAKSAALVFHRLEKVKPEQRRCLVGIVADGESVQAVEPPLQCTVIPAREVVVARLSAHKSIAAFKAYRRIRDEYGRWLTDNGYRWGAPALEIYLSDGQVEFQVPIVRIGDQR